MLRVKQGPLRVVMAASGTRGEIDPFIALACALRTRGFNVVLVVSEGNETRARALGVETVVAEGDLSQSLAGEKNRGVWQGERASVERWNEDFYLPGFRRALETIWRLSAEADLLLLHSGFLPARKAAELRGIPLIIGCPFPVLTPTARFPHLLARRRRLGPLYNRLTYQLNRCYSRGEYRVISDWHRSTLRVPAPARFEDYVGSGSRQVPVLYCYSELLVPRPPEWGAATCVSGYWMLPSEPDWAPPADLSAFLAAGSPPIYLGFGSTIGANPEALSEAVAGAVRRLPQHRFLISGGWGGLRRDGWPGHCHFIGNIPFQWLFPQVSLVVHHCGTGTLATAMLAGRVSVLCPLGADQPFWARAATARGITPPWRMLGDISSDWLVGAIEAALHNPEYARNVSVLGEKLQAEDSFGKAAAFIHEQVRHFHENRHGRRTPAAEFAETR